MDSPVQWILGLILFFSSLGVILLRKPVHASLSFLLTLFTLAVYYLQLNAQFISVIQVIVYAGAILVLFMFVIILFQDAHEKIKHIPARTPQGWVIFACILLLIGLIVTASQFLGLPNGSTHLPKDYGTVQAIGKELYLDFFIPFEAATLLFLIALIGALYIAKRVRQHG